MRPEADFTWVNGAEPATLDPAIATGVPENRLLRCIFEGLTDADPATLDSKPGVAESWEISEDGLRYLFNIRKEAQWSNGDPLTAHDFVWSWQRVLEPVTAAQYAYQLYYIKGAHRYNGYADGAAWVTKGETKVTGVSTSWARIENAMVGDFVQFGDDEDKYTVASIESDSELTLSEAYRGKTSAEAGPYMIRLEDFGQVGVKALDDYTLEVLLENPTPYFLSLTNFYTLFPVHRKTVETWGDEWIKPEHMVSNGPFILGEWRLRESIYFIKSETYWDKGNVKLNSARALPAENSNTGFNLYAKGPADWIEGGAMPTYLMEVLLDHPEMHRKPYLGIYFARVNVTRPPLDDPRVRKAFAISFRREDICTYIVKSGQVPAFTYVPPMHGYTPAPGYEYNPEKARELLREAGYPGGKGMPKVEYLYNTLEAHRDIAEVLQAQWKETLGVEIELVNQEWKVYLDSQRQLEYGFSRSGWIGDYADPDTFLNMFVTNGGNNNTGWSDPEYDNLIALASRTRNPQERLAVLTRAETILLERGPTLPIYFYVSTWMYPEYVHGTPINVLGQLFMKYVSVDKEAKRKVKG